MHSFISAKAKSPTLGDKPRGSGRGEAAFSKQGVSQGTAPVLGAQLGGALSDAVDTLGIALLVDVSFSAG